MSSLPCFHEGGTAAVADVTDGELVLFEVVPALRALPKVDFARLIGPGRVGDERDGYETVLHIDSFV